MILCHRTESQLQGQQIQKAFQRNAAGGIPAIERQAVPDREMALFMTYATRKNMIFRIRNKIRQPDKVVTGNSDHPDRRQFGEWLEYEQGNDLEVACYTIAPHTMKEKQWA